MKFLCILRIFQEKFSRRYPSTTWLMLCSIIIIGSLLRFYRLSYFDLWYDEAFSVIQAANLDRFMRLIRFTYLPPLYYSILHLWIKCFGNSEFSIRLLSAFAGTLSIPFIYLLGKYFSDTKVGLLSAFILAVSPFHIWYSQEARMYELSVLLSLMLVYIFVKAIQFRNNVWWFLCAIVSIVNVYLNYFSLFLLFSILFFGFSCKGFHRKIIFLYFLSVFISLFPLGIIIGEQIATIKNNFWIPFPDFSLLFIVLGNIIVGYSETVFNSNVAISLFLLLLIFWIVTFKREKEYFLLLSYTFVPFIFIFIISKVIPIFIARVFIIFSPFFYIIISKGMVQVKSKIIIFTVSFFFLYLMISSLNNYYIGRLPAPDKFHVGIAPRKHFKPIIKVVRERMKTGDIIAHSNFHTLPTFLYYLHGTGIKQYFLKVTEEQYDPYWRKIFKRSFPFIRRETFWYGVRELGKERKFYKGMRMWLVSSNWRIDGRLDNHSEAVLERSTKRFKKISSFYHDGIYVNLFSMEK